MDVPIDTSDLVRRLHGTYLSRFDHAFPAARLEKLARAVRDALDGAPRPSGAARPGG